MTFLFALSPILFLLALVFVRRLAFFRSAGLVLLYTFLLTTIGWSLPGALLGPIALKATLLSLDILLIVSGALFFLNFLRKTGLMKSMETQLRAVSPDRRIQALILAWLLGSFIEGTSGFGTPAAVVAPLLIGIGFPTVTAITVCLLANSTAVAFGAVGTPLRVGFDGLAIAGVPERAAFINAFVGMIIPILILAIIVRTAREDRSNKFLEALPWTIFSGAAFLIPYFAFSFMGYEFPSIFGAAIGLMLALVSLKFGFLIPRETFEFPGSIESQEKTIPTGLMKSVFPYALLLGLLLLGKLLFAGLNWKIALGGGMSHSLHFFNPGFAFFTVIMVLSILGIRAPHSLRGIVMGTAAPLGRTAVSIFCIAATTYLMVASRGTSTEGMLDVLAGPLHSPALPLLSALVGAFGAFMAGSATVSNILFGELQTQAAESIGYSTSWILALQLVGAGAGNMIALPNILAVEAAVGVRDQEARMIKLLAPACALYLLLAGGIGLLAMKLGGTP